MKKPDWSHTPQPLTPKRKAEIEALAEGLREDAAYDIEDFRVIYTALIDLLDAAVRTCSCPCHTDGTNQVCEQCCE